MAIYLCLLIPVLSVLVLFFFFRHKTVWWELIIPLIASIIFVFSGKQIAISSLTDDIQYLGGYVNEVRYYEEWNEKVSCRHPIYKTRCHGIGKKRHCSTYLAGYRHAFDVDYHAPKWTEETNLGTIDINSGRYKEILHNKFKLEKADFHELNRHSYSIDGDMYSGLWNKADSTLIPVTISDTYENKPKASHSIYHFQELDSFDIKTYKPFDYPTIDKNNYQNALLGIKNPAVERKLALLNAKLGKEKHVRVFILVFKNQPLDAGHIQERYWEGSNKNEFVICIGTNDYNDVKWVYDFSWTEVESTKVETRDFLLAQSTLNLDALVDFTYNEINTKWIPRNFHEFDIITIEPSFTAIMWIFILTILLNCGIAWWIIANDFSEETKKQYNRY